MKSFLSVALIFGAFSIFCMSCSRSSDAERRSKCQAELRALFFEILEVLDSHSIKLKSGKTFQELMTELQAKRRFVCSECGCEFELLNEETWVELFRKNGTKELDEVIDRNSDKQALQANSGCAT